MVFWTFTVEGRKTDWVGRDFRGAWEKCLLHTAFRFEISFPLYVLMPDHLHFLAFGLGPRSDQRLAVSFLRTHCRPGSNDWQAQPHDHVLRDEDRERGAIASTAWYILENPVRAGLVEDPKIWPWLGCAVPGYPRLSPMEEDYWEKYWRIHAKLLERAVR